uniref:Uncharacterized protein n=2 Tax=Anguilla anguilla TaxID=7936 RepID=A0A0E9PZZ5_ANGAN
MHHKNWSGHQQSSPCSEVNSCFQSICNPEQNPFELWGILKVKIKNK